MSRAEEKANKRWPIHPWTILPKEGEHGEIINFDEWLDDFRLGVQSFSLNAGYKDGYEQAEKDLALTWEDIAEIDALIIEANNEFAVNYSKEISREQFYTEVLNRFNKLKEK